MDRRGSLLPPRGAEAVPAKHPKMCVGPIGVTCCHVLSKSIVINRIIVGIVSVPLLWQQPRHYFPPAAAVNPEDSAFGSEKRKQNFKLRINCPTPTLVL